MVREFCEWARAKGIRLASLDGLEHARLGYFDEMLELGRLAGAGTKLFAALVFQLPTMQELLQVVRPQVRKALRGWARALPGGTRQPLPWGVVYAIVAELVRRGLYEMGVATVLAADAYLRPAAAMALQVNGVLVPRPEMGPAFRYWTLLLFPREQGEASKVGEFDDSLVLDSPERQWRGDCLARLKRGRGGGTNIFGFQVDAWRGEARGSRGRDRGSAVGGVVARYSARWPEQRRGRGEAIPAGGTKERQVERPALSQTLRKERTPLSPAAPALSGRAEPCAARRALASTYHERRPRRAAAASGQVARVCRALLRMVCLPVSSGRMGSRSTRASLA